MTPLVLEIVIQLRRNPVPYLLALAMASNVGSTATITGNPQNMIIGSVSQIPYGSFAAALSPIAACGLALTILLIAVIHRREFFTRERLEPLPRRPPRYHGPLVVKSVLVAAGMMVLFFVIAGVERAVLSPQAIAAIGRMHLASMPMLATVTAALSNLVSNVPAVLV